MKAIEMKDLSLDELKKRLADEQENLANLRFQLATSQLESPIKVRLVRRDIARIKTVIRERELKQAAHDAQVEVKES
ncbi:MAG: 50S ribosomal protein L29 [Ignavibacteria bacterium]|nr:50S ribosomal protein L29 [Ignavibacteria bacterium]